jgi:hypothetical protein
VRTVSPHRKIDGSGALADICPSPLPASPCWSRRRRSSASEVVSTSACPTTPGYRRFSVACEAVRGTPVRIRLRRSRCFPAETDRSPAGRDSASRDAAIICRQIWRRRTLMEAFFPTMTCKLSARGSGPALPLQKRQAPLGLSIHLYRLRVPISNLEGFNRARWLLF